jgi:hypothetical protein
MAGRALVHLLDGSARERKRKTMSWKAQHSRESAEYYQAPYTAQHFLDWVVDFVRRWVVDLPLGIWDALRYLASNKHRIEQARAYNQLARAYNQLMFGNIPTAQIYATDGEQVRPLREEERTWPA